MTEDDKHHIAVMYEMGLPIADISEAVGRGSSVVRRALRALGYPVTHSRRPVALSEVSDWVARYQRGQTISDIAAETGRDRGLISRSIRRKGIQIIWGRRSSDTCAKGRHPMGQYGAPVWSRDKRTGEWRQHGRRCVACAYEKRGKPIPTPQKVQEIIARSVNSRTRD